MFKITFYIEGNLNIIAFQSKKKKEEKKRKKGNSKVNEMDY